MGIADNIGDLVRSEVGKQTATLVAQRELLIDVFSKAVAVMQKAIDHVRNGAEPKEAPANEKKIDSPPPVGDSWANLKLRPDRLMTYGINAVRAVSTIKHRPTREEAAQQIHHMFGGTLGTARQRVFYAVKSGLLRKHGKGRLGYTLTITKTGMAVLNGRVAGVGPRAH